MAKKITLEELKELCLQYDLNKDAWPESKYEGRSLYYFIAEQAFGEKISAEAEDLIEQWDDELYKIQVAKTIRPL
jgi:hypothetical protein